jgi:hypothetical protein
VVGDAESAERDRRFDVHGLGVESVPDQLGKDVDRVGAFDVTPGSGSARSPTSLLWPARPAARAAPASESKLTQIV